MPKPGRARALSVVVLENGEKPLNFACADSALGGCEGKMRLGPFPGIYCTKHLNQRAEELGVYRVSDDPIHQGEDDWARRHPRARKK